ncbi:hypothetical protein C1Y40_04575 [Mycobacterium talmoniae]|uniref:ParB-like N-terminal domain-containing protein n=1 Tax=Mycobacterium talmoniae TaxID=1858794 RepID=A0A2S8BF00_9MYCO|nr:ParB/RepB/Spo0J family partition protein [Mycobacterium eburneum]PQM45251.1 hypothetical protein C1Y40_04575 [Mycobacterium talmoniae]
MTAKKTTNPTGATLEHLDPHHLDIGENVRDNAQAGQPFADLVASITEYGVLVAVSAIRAQDGTITVRDGQRRVLAARQAGLTQVPVYVVDDRADDDQTRSVERITHQIVANDHRAALTEGQRAKGIQQLLIAGLTPTKVAKALTIPKTTVDAAAAAAKSETALTALDTTQLTIEQAAVLVEFEHDAEATEYLTTAASTGEFDHRVSELRQQAATAAARADAASQYQATGHQVLDARPGWSEPLSRHRIHQLCTPEGKSVAEDIVNEKPELWAVWLEEMPVYIDTRTGEIIDDHDIDWDIDPDDDDATPEDGLIHPKHVNETTAFDPAWYCLDPAAAGLTSWSERNRGRAMTGHETEEAAAARKEAERREKRKVVALNKLGAAAQQVRQDWVKDKLLSRKTPPKGAAIFIAGQLAAHPHLLTGSHVMPTARTLLGLAEHAPIGDAVSQLPPTGDQRAAVITLALILAALETETPKDAWRNTYGSYSKSYLAFLADNGYELADIEKVITGAQKADKLYEKISNDTPNAAKVA